MKKRILFMLFLMVFVLVGCQEPEETPSETLTPLSEIAQTVTLFDQPLTANISLPSAVQGVGVSWTSLNQARLSNAGAVTRPLHEEGDAVFVIEGLFSRDDEVHVERYDVTVLAEPFVPRDYEAEIDAMIASFEFLSEPQAERIIWPTQIDDATLSFSSLSPTYLRNDGFVLQPLARLGDANASVEVTFTIEGEVFTRLLDVAIAAKPALAIVDTAVYDFVSIATEYLVDDSEITLHRMNNGLMFVDVFDFLALVDGAIVYDELELNVDGSVVEIVLPFEPDEDFPLTYDSYHLVLDFENNTVTVNLFSFFGGIAQSTQTDFGAGLSLISYEHITYDPVVFDLSFYRLELWHHEDQFLMPLDVANLFFTGQMYDVYFNGDQLRGADTYQLLDRGADLRSLNVTSFRNTEIPMELRIMTYHYFTFVMDHFYGLRDFMVEETFYTFLADLNHNFFGTSRSHYTAWFRTVYNLDEPHSSHLLHGFHTVSRDLALNPINGPRMNRFIGQLQSLCLIGDSPSEGVSFLDNDRIAMITLDGFSAQTPDAMRGYMDEIIAKGSVQDIILNLACNTGGILGTAWQVMGHMTDEPLTYQSFNIGDGSRITAEYDTDTVAPDFTWYILTSPVTFSAANLVTSMAKDMGIATIIGQQSSGGASSITTNILPNGTILIISSANVLANSNFESIEFGIPVDVAIDPNRLFDEEALIEAIRP